jgi:hypothetical protein
VFGDAQHAILTGNAKNPGFNLPDKTRATLIVKYQESCWGAKVDTQAGAPNTPRSSECTTLKRCLTASKRSKTEIPD